jgi:hypothetical protein
MALGFARSVIKIFCYAFGKFLNILQRVAQGYNECPKKS